MGSQLLQGCVGDDVSKTFKPGSTYKKSNYAAFDDFLSCRKKPAVDPSVHTPPWSAPVVKVRGCKDIITSPSVSTSCGTRAETSSETTKKLGDHYPSLILEVEELGNDVSLLKETSTHLQRTFKSVSEGCDNSQRDIQEIAGLAHQSRQEAEVFSRSIRKQQTDLNHIYVLTENQTAEIERLRTDMEDLKRERDRLLKLEQQRDANGLVGQFVATFFKLIRIESQVPEGKELPRSTEKRICEKWSVNYDWVCRRRYWVYAFSTCSGVVSGGDAKARREEVLSQIDGCYSSESDMSRNLGDVIDAIIKYGFLLDTPPRTRGFFAQLFGR